MANWQGILVGLGLAGVGATPWAAPPVASTWQLAAGGHEVRDTRMGLTWSRCLEGTQWDGQRCAGLPRMVSHAEALKLARQKPPAGTWRLPRVPELQHAVVQAPPLDASGQVVFPDVPGVWLWTATAHVDGRTVNPYDYGNVQRGLTGDNAVQMNFLHGWAVHQPGGQADGKVLKRQRLAVRLVR